MAIFVVSLFGPYTIAFHEASKVPSLQTGSPASKKEGVQVEDYYNHKERRQPVHVRSNSLSMVATYTNFPTVRSPLAIGQTPGATTYDEHVFRPNTGTLAYKVPLSGIIRNKSTTSLKTIASFDPQSVPWGKNTDLLQPKSLAVSPPSQSIFDDTAPAKEINVTEPLFAKQFDEPRPSRREKKEVAYTTENYTVEPATLGNVALFAAVNAVSADAEPVDKYWVGTLGMPTDILSDEVKTHIADTLENDHDMLVVYVEDTGMNNCYENYCKTILWPLLHSQVLDVPAAKAFQDNSWEQYKTLNRLFADMVVKNYKDGDTVWVHDYHLMLVPQYVREHHPRARIGVYFHTAFPPSELFRNLPSRYELIFGMLGANMIAFQTASFRYQFLQTCSRLLNIEATEHGLVLENGQFVDVFSIPMGIDIETINIGRQLPEVEDRMKELTEKFNGKRLIVARDKLDNVNGLKHKLRGYRHFLERYPQWRDKVVLVQIATSTSSDRQLKESINELITEINGDWGDLNYQPIVYLNKDIDFAQYIALLSIADCMLVTSLSEGMNLTCHEFLVCQDKSLNLKGHNPLVVSEFIGAAEVFGDNAVLVNPWHPKGIADALDKALSMSADERDARWEKMYALTEEHSARKWLKMCTENLHHAWKEHSLRDPSTVPRLAIRDVRQKYILSEKRLIIVDFEGTLTTWDSPKEQIVTVPFKVVQALSSLVEDEKNTVYVMSQRTADGLEHMFRMVPKLGLIAENGALLRRPGKKTWLPMVKIDTSIWRKGVMDVLSHYESSIPGSVVKELKSGIIFHYFDSEDQQDAKEKVGELANQINEMCENLGVTAVPFEKGLYIQLSKINKALATKHIEAEMFRKNITPPDFVLAIGDSREDECVFDWAHGLRGRVSNDRVITCVVGKRSTAASAVLTQGSIAVVSALEKLVMSEASRAA